METEAEDAIQDPPDGLSAEELAQFYRRQARHLAKILSARQVPSADAPSSRVQTTPADVSIDLRERTNRYGPSSRDDDMSRTDASEGTIDDDDNSSYETDTSGTTAHTTDYSDAESQTTATASRRSSRSYSDYDIGSVNDSSSARNTSEITETRVKSILKPSSQKQAKRVMSRKQSKVGFKRRPDFEDVIKMTDWEVLRCVVHCVAEGTPLRTGQPVFEPDGVDHDMPSAPLSLWDVLHVVGALLAPFLVSALVLCFPMRGDTDGDIERHWGFVLCIMPCCGLVIGLYALLWLEVFFSRPFEHRLWLMMSFWPASCLFYGIAWVTAGGIVPFGVELTLLFCCLLVTVFAWRLLPHDVRAGDGFKGKLAVGVTVFGGSALCIRILSLFEYASSRGPETSYLLVLILPVIFTRLTTDIQEAIPYTSQDFAIIAQALVSWIFSLSSYFILLMHSNTAALWSLYFVQLLSDISCVAGVGPIWALWSNVGYLKTSKYHQTIFGWSQRPLKPRPIFVKYVSRAVAASSFVILVSIIYESENGQAFRFENEGVIDRGTLSQLWACMLLDVAVSLLWVIFVYRLMKRRCSSVAFTHTIWRMAKTFVAVSIGGIVVTLMAFLTRCEESYSLF